MEQSTLNNECEVRNLLQTVNSIIGNLSKDLKKRAAKEERDNPVDDATFNVCMKIIDNIGKFEQFEKVFNKTEEPNKKKNAQTETESVSSTPIIPIDGNAFEAVSKKVQQKMNGKH